MPNMDPAIQIEWRKFAGCRCASSGWRVTTGFARPTAQRRLYSHAPSGRIPWRPGHCRTAPQSSSAAAWSAVCDSDMLSGTSTEEERSRRQRARHTSSTVEGANQTMGAPTPDSRPSKMDWCTPDQVNMSHRGGRPPSDQSWLFCAPKTAPGDEEARVRIRRSEIIRAKFNLPLVTLRDPGRAPGGDYRPGPRPVAASSAR